MNIGTIQNKIRAIVLAIHEAECLGAYVPTGFKLIQSGDSESIKLEAKVSMGNDTTSVEASGVDYEDALQNLLAKSLEEGQSTLNAMTSVMTKLVAQVSSEEGSQEQEQEEDIDLDASWGDVVGMLDAIMHEAVLFNQPLKVSEDADSLAWSTENKTWTVSRKVWLDQKAQMPPAMQEILSKKPTEVPIHWTAFRRIQSASQGK